MSEMSELTGKNFENPTGDPTPVVQEAGQGVDLGAISRATGLDLGPGDLNQGNVPIPVAIPEKQITPVSTPRKGSMSFISAEEAAALGASDGEVLDVEKMADQESEKRYQESRQQEVAEMNKMFGDLLAGEEARIERMENTKADEEAAKKLLPEEQQARPVERIDISSEDRLRNERRSGNPIISDEDLVPDYQDDEKEEKAPEAVEKAPDPGDDEYGEYIRNLEHVRPEASDHGVVEVIKDKNISIVPAYKVKEQSLGDQALMNAISKFKKEHFAKVTVPLVNSGFMCDISGTGVIDIQMLYMNVDQNTTLHDYTLEQMKTVIRNVVGTSPKISRNSLNSMIHADDFDMMAYGHICATLRSVETVTNCQECGKPFRITDDPVNLLINAKELNERAEQIKNAPNVEAFSLMSHHYNIQCDNGIIVTIGHPSYSEKVRSIQGYEAAIKSMTAADQHRFASMLDTLYMVRKVQLPSGVYSNTIYQHFLMISLLNQDDMDTVTKEIDKMKKDVLHPKFGIREVRCPHCGSMNKDIAYENLLELLFYHTTISSFLNNPES